MNVVVLNASPLKGRGNTALVLQPFVEGMKEAGASVDLYHTIDLSVSPCRGDLSCWLKTNGRCVIEDDMRWLLPKLGEADLWVLATPVYVDGMVSTLKAVLERTVPLGMPNMELRNGRLRHPSRYARESRRSLVLVSSCGFWERETFAPLVAHVRALAANMDAVYAGALLRPHAPCLGPMLEQGAPVRDVLDAAREAGRQLVRDGAFVAATLDTVSRDLLPRDLFAAMLNASVSGMQARRDTPGS
jgi:hypothetical protein